MLFPYALVSMVLFGVMIVAQGVVVSFVCLILGVLVFTFGLLRLGRVSVEFTEYALRVCNGSRAPLDISWDEIVEIRRRWLGQSLSGVNGMLVEAVIRPESGTQLRVPVYATLLADREYREFFVKNMGEFAAAHEFSVNENVGTGFSWVHSK